MKFVLIPAGKFQMGSPLFEKNRADNETLHPVRITKPFWMAATHVTVAQFAWFTKETGYQTSAEKEGWAYGAWNEQKKRWNKLYGGSWKDPGFAQTENNPVVCVDWFDAVAFCGWLSAKEGRKYRLPTEAEWEYASRAGTQTAYPWGDDPDNGQGWVNGCDETSSNEFNLFPPFNWSDGYRYTSPVATFKPNAWGIYDPLGNALQWCSDWFGDYPTNSITDPQGVPTGQNRILRGGAFVYGPARTRSAFRGRNTPDFKNFYVGFRVVREN